MKEFTNKKQVQQMFNFHFVSVSDSALRIACLIRKGQLSCGIVLEFTVLEKSKILWQTFFCQDKLKTEGICVLKDQHVLFVEDDKSITSVLTGISASEYLLQIDKQSA